MTAAAIATSSTSRWQRIGPIVSLLVLAPVIAEVLYGATRLSTLFVLIPEILTWGCSALLIRECIQRWNKQWPSKLLMGIAMAIAEEWIIQQTSIAPLAGLAQQAYGRVWGINWVYFLWAIGYESVWVVLVPIQLTEILFPARRNEPWLRARGIVIACIAFLVGAYMAWYGWTQRARVQIFHMPPYKPPVLYLLGAAAVILLLIFAASMLPDIPSRSKSAPSPWTVALAITLLGSPWAAFVLLGFGSVPQLSYLWVLLLGFVWSAVTFLLLLRWTSSSDWGVRQKYALVLGGVLACSIGGFVVFKVGGAARIDWIGKGVFDAIAILWLIAIRRKVVAQTNVVN